MSKLYILIIATIIGSYISIQESEATLEMLYICYSRNKEGLILCPLKGLSIHEHDILISRHQVIHLMSCIQQTNRWCR